MNSRLPLQLSLHIIVPCLRLKYIRQCLTRAVFGTSLLLAGIGQSAIASTTLSGTITNRATGRTLEGARVALQGTGTETIADQDGTYYFDNLPDGTVTLAVSYTGLDPVVVQVELRPGLSNRRDIEMTSSIYQMSEFVVPGEREGNAKAITLQRQSDGVKSVVSSDAFGSLAGNPAELLVRLPGVDGQWGGGDIRFIRVRGLHQNLNTITMDGNRMSSLESSRWRSTWATASTIHFKM
jgi:iron complex outermembrane receptor protein